MKELTLRNMIEDAKGKYLERNGMLDRYWKDEGLIFTLESYYSSIGSVLNFTEDDWQACKGNDLSLYDVVSACCEPWFHEEMSEIGRYLSLAVECWRNESDERDECLIPDEDIPKEVVDGFISNFYTWRRKKLPMVKAIYSNKE